MLFFDITACFCVAEIIEDVAESPAPPAAPVSVVSPPSQEKEAYKRLGLTKQVLAAHTQKEEQAFLNRCRELRSARSLQREGSSHLHRQRSPANAAGTAGTAKAVDTPERLTHGPENSSSYDLAPPTVVSASHIRSFQTAFFFVCS